MAEHVIGNANIEVGAGCNWSVQNTNAWIFLSASDRLNLLHQVNPTIPSVLCPLLLLQQPAKNPARNLHLRLRRNENMDTEIRSNWNHPFLCYWMAFPCINRRVVEGENWYSSINPLLYCLIDRFIKIMAYTLHKTGNHTLNVSWRYRLVRFSERVWVGWHVS